MIGQKRFEHPSAQLAAREREAVYLLHGFAGKPLLMRRLANCLGNLNYAVQNWGYSSTRTTISHHAAALRAEIDRVCDEDAFDRIHFVTHSMGSIVVRHAFQFDQPAAVGRIVMLAPPNRGSHFAWVGGIVLGRFCPVLRELSTSSDSYVNRTCDEIRAEVGVIAASNDWVVRRRNTHLPTQRDHIVVRGDRVRLPLLQACAVQTVHFLSKGSFQHPRDE